jgi:hypothetical protein
VDTLSTTFLGVIALSSLVQALFVIALALAGRRLFAKLEELQERVDRQLDPVMGQVTKIARNVADVSDTVVAQGRRVDEFIADTTGKLRDTTDYVHRAAVKGAAPLVEIGALWRGVKRAFEAWQEPEAARAGRRPERGARGMSPTPGLGRPHDVWAERQADIPRH